MPEENTETASETINSTVDDAEKLAVKTDFLISEGLAAATAAEGTLDSAVTNALDINDIEIVTQANRVMDLAQCAKNIPAALLGLAIKKGISYLANLPITGTALDIVQIIALIQKIMDQYALLMLLIEKLKDPETLLMMLANAKILQGQSLIQKIDEIKKNFPGVEGLDGVLNSIESLDLCNADFSLEYLLGGIKKLPLTEIPTAVVSLRSKYGGVVTDNLDRNLKGDYDSVLFKIREGTLKDDSRINELRKAASNGSDTQGLRHYNEMLTLVNVLAYSYHDDIKKAGKDESQYASIKSKYEQNVATELQKNGGSWSAETINDFKGRTATIGAAFNSGASSVGAFYNPTVKGETTQYSTTGNQEYGGLSKEAYDLMLFYEVGGGKSSYEKLYSKANWPGGKSGITIGIGYDIGMNRRGTFVSDWTGILSDSDLNRLADCAGIIGSAAKNKVSSVNDISISWEAAQAVFVKKTIPRYKRECLIAFPGADKLHPSAFGALCSMVFNRGPSTSGKRREEMANIRAAIIGQTKVTDIYDYIANQIIASKRIWANTGQSGLLKRRDKEAALVRSAKGSSSNVA
jgi:GH24 family phage-related lysozyme (muramidase)